MGMDRTDRFKLKLIDLSDDTSVAAATDRTETHTPSTGKIHEIVKFLINIPDPAGSAAGTHELKASYVSTGLLVNVAALFLIKATTGNNVGTYYNEYGGDSSEIPSNAREQTLQNSGGYQVFCNNDNPIYFIYSNDTDVAQAGTRTIKLLVKEYNEV